MIVVMVQYRLGLFGWLKYPRFGFEGNYGLRDLILALRMSQIWLHPLVRVLKPLDRSQRLFSKTSLLSEETLHSSRSPVKVRARKQFELSSALHLPLRSSSAPYFSLRPSTTSLSLPR